MELQEWPDLVRASVQAQSKKYEASAEQLKGNMSEWAEVVRQTTPSKDPAAGTCFAQIPVCRVSWSLLLHSQMKQCRGFETSQASKDCCAALALCDVPGPVMPDVFLQASVQCRTCGSLLQAPPGTTEIR